MSLTLFLWVYIVCIGINILARFVMLAFKPYPRTMEYARWEDCLAIIVQIVFGIWACTLLRASLGL